MKRLYKINFKDYLLAILIIILSALPLLNFNLLSQEQGGNALIYQDSKLKYTLSLNQDRLITIDKMSIRVKQGKIAVEDSNCPQKICVHAGWISKPNERIVCLPNKVYIEIKGITQNNEYDVVSY